MIKNISILIILIATCHFKQSPAQTDQDQLLAQQYYQNSEYEKAAVLYEKLLNTAPFSSYYYHNYYNTLLKLEDYKGAEKVVKKQKKRLPKDLSLMVDLGYIYSLSGEIKKANSQYEQAVNVLVADVAQINRLAKSFMLINEFNYALKVYEQGQKLFKNNKLFQFELAEIYEAKRDATNMIRLYLDFLQYNPLKIQAVKNALQEKAAHNPYSNELQSQLFKRIQKDPSKTIYAELLIWHLLQKRDFSAALIQAKALDKRLKENGLRVLTIGQQAFEEKDYDIAIECHQYVIDKGKNNYLYLSAKKALLKTKREKIINTAQYTNASGAALAVNADILGLEADYYQFINEFGKNNSTCSTIRELCDLLARYKHELDAAIKLAEELMGLANIERHLKAEMKLDLGDYYLMKGDIWEATLIYSQVDKQFKEDPLGEQARFKNAKLSYYTGDFEWAQAQLRILKAATSELIANDALDLSIFLTAHMGLDTTEIPMQLFARADLLILQNREQEAMHTLDSILLLYTDHTLTDDIGFTKAKMMIRRHNYEQAAAYLEDVYRQYSTGILADDALFQLANLYESYLNDKARAMQLYQDLIVDYQGSVFVVEARKRFRKLRGDKIN